MQSFGRVIELWRYPVSSMGGERLEQARLSPGGFEHDRLWGIVEAQSGEIAAPENRKPWRPLPNLHSRIGPDGIEVSDGDSAWLPVDSAEAAEMASRFLGFPAAFRPHLPYGSEAEGRIAPRYQRADIHLLTTASLRELGDLLGRPEEVQPRRFRPNIVVETDPEFTGLVEQRLIGRKLAIGDAIVTFSEPCARCTFTALAQGELAFMPAVLHKISQHGEGGFGALCTVEGEATLRVGDTIGFADR